MEEIQFAQAPPWLIASAARLVTEHSSIKSTIPADAEVAQPAAAPAPTTGTIIEAAYGRFADRDTTTTPRPASQIIAQPHRRVG